MWTLSGVLFFDWYYLLGLRKADFMTETKRENIDISNKKTLAEWCEKLCCTEKDLIEAVLTIGNSAKIVDAFLYLNRKKIK